MGWLLPNAFSPCPCPAVLRRWPQALGKPALAKALARWECWTLKPKAGCFHRWPALGSPSSQHMCRARCLLVGGIGVFASPVAVKGLMLSRRMRGHSQDIPRWAGGLTVLPEQGAEPTLVLAVPPGPLLRGRLQLLDLCGCCYPAAWLGS